ncbi:hypothetical protein FMM79_10795 [Novosphingobium sp. BW1]|nr:hypothetical protein FMM79_10795 [Novosphingobium sp. BW1]
MNAAAMNTIATPTNPKAYNHPDRPTLVDADVGRVGSAVLALTRELWVLTDRVAVMEELLTQNGINIAEQIETFQPSAKMQEKLDARGKHMVEMIVAALAGTEGA